MDPLQLLCVLCVFVLALVYLYTWYRVELVRSAKTHAVIKNDSLHGEQQRGQGGLNSA